MLKYLLLLCFVINLTFGFPQRINDIHESGGQDKKSSKLKNVVYDMGKNDLNYKPHSWRSTDDDIIAILPSDDVNKKSLVYINNILRNRRQIDLSLEAEHEETVGTEIIAEANVNLWKSIDGNTRLYGGAKYSQQFGYDRNGNAKYGGKIKFRHDYK